MSTSWRNPKVSNNAPRLPTSSLLDDDDDDFPIHTKPTTGLNSERLRRSKPGPGIRGNFRRNPQEPDTPLGGDLFEAPVKDIPPSPLVSGIASGPKGVKKDLLDFTGQNDRIPNRSFQQQPVKSEWNRDPPSRTLGRPPRPQSNQPLTNAEPKLSYDSRRTTAMHGERDPFKPSSALGTGTALRQPMQPPRSQPKSAQHHSQQQPQYQYQRQSQPQQYHPTPQQRHQPQREPQGHLQRQPRPQPQPQQRQPLSSKPASAYPPREPEPYQRPSATSTAAPTHTTARPAANNAPPLSMPRSNIFDRKPLDVKHMPMHRAPRQYLYAQDTGVDDNDEPKFLPLTSAKIRPSEPIQQHPTQNSEEADVKSSQKPRSVQYPRQLTALVWFYVKDIVMWSDFCLSASFFVVGLSCLVLSMMLELPLFSVAMMAVLIHIMFSVFTTILRFLYYRIIRASPREFEESQSNLVSSSVFFDKENIESFASAFAHSINHTLFTYQRAAVMRPFSYTVLAMFIFSISLFLSLVMDLTTAGLFVFIALFTVPKGLSLMLFKPQPSRYVRDRRRDQRRGYAGRF